MADFERSISIMLLDPDEIRRDRKDPESVRLYYRWFYNERAEGKRYMVAVKFLNGDAYVLTSSPARHPNPGEVLWTRLNG